MKLVVADTLPASAIELFRSVPGWIVDARAQRSAEQLANDVADAEAIVVRSATTVDRALIDAAPRLRVIARAGTGVDNVDVEAATARGIVVMNAPGANSISVAELAIGLMLSLSRGDPGCRRGDEEGDLGQEAADRRELRGKTLGIVGLGRIGQEVAARASAVRDDARRPRSVHFRDRRRTLGISLLPLDELCEAADYLTLHIPVTAETRHIVNRERLARCKAGVRIVNTARGELIDDRALAEAIESGAVAGAALDVFEKEPPSDWTVAKLPQRRRDAAHCRVDCRSAGTGRHRNRRRGARLSPQRHDYQRRQLSLRPRRGCIATASFHDPRRTPRHAALAGGKRTHQSAWGPATMANSSRRTGRLIANAAIAGVLRPILSTAVTVVNARAVASQRGIEIIESRSSRPRNFANLLSLKLHTDAGETWVEGTVFEPGSPRLTQIDGVDIEAPLEGTLLVIHNEDQPGVIGEVGTILGRHGLNIASFALGRGEGGAFGVVNLDVGAEKNLTAAVEELRTVRAIRKVSVVRL